MQCGCPNVTLPTDSPLQFLGVLAVPLMQMSLVLIVFSGLLYGALVFHATTQRSTLGDACCTMSQPVQFFVELRTSTFISCPRSIVQRYGRDTTIADVKTALADITAIPRSMISLRTPRHGDLPDASTLASLKIANDSRMLLTNAYAQGLPGGGQNGDADNTGGGGPSTSSPRHGDGDRKRDVRGDPRAADEAAAFDQPPAPKPTLLQGRNAAKHQTGAEYAAVAAKGKDKAGATGMDRRLLELRRKLQQAEQRQNQNDAKRYRGEISELERRAPLPVKAPDDSATLNNLLQNPRDFGLLGETNYSVHTHPADCLADFETRLTETPFRERPKTAAEVRALPAWSPWRKTPELNGLPYMDHWTCHAPDDNSKHLYLVHNKTNDIGFAHASSYADAEAVESCVGAKSPLTLTAALCKLSLSRRAQWIGVLSAMGVTLRSGQLTWPDVVTASGASDFLTTADPASHIPLAQLRDILRMCQQMGLPPVTTTCGWGDSIGPQTLCCSPVHLTKCNGTVILFAPRLYQNRGCNIRYPDEPATLASYAVKALRHAKSNALGLQAVVVVAAQNDPAHSHFERWYETADRSDKCLEVAHAELVFNGGHYGAVVFHRDGQSSERPLRVFTPPRQQLRQITPVTLTNCLAQKWIAICRVTEIPRGSGSRGKRFAQHILGQLKLPFLSERCVTELPQQGRLMFCRLDLSELPARTETLTADVEQGDWGAQDRLTEWTECLGALTTWLSEWDHPRWQQESAKHHLWIVHEPTWRRTVTQRVDATGDMPSNVVKDAGGGWAPAALCSLLSGYVQYAIPSGRHNEDRVINVALGDTHSLLHVAEQLQRVGLPCTARSNGPDGARTWPTADAAPSAHLLSIQINAPGTVSSADLTRMAELLGEELDSVKQSATGGLQITVRRPCKGAAMLHSLAFQTDDGDPINILVDHPAGARATKQLCTAVCGDKATVDAYRTDAIARLTSNRPIQEPTEDILLHQLRTTTQALPDGRAKTVSQRVLDHVAVLRDHRSTQQDGASVDTQQDKIDTFVQQRVDSVQRAIGDAMHSPDIRALQDQQTAIGDAQKLMAAERQSQIAAEVDAKFDCNRDSAVQFFHSKTDTARKPTASPTLHPEVSPSRQLDLDSPEPAIQQGNGDSHGQEHHGKHNKVSNQQSLPCPFCAWKPKRAKAPTPQSLSTHICYQHGSAPHAPGSSAGDRQDWTKKQKWAESQIPPHPPIAGTDSPLPLVCASSGTTIATASPSLGCASSGTIPATASPSLGCASSGTIPATASPSLGCASSGTTIATASPSLGCASSGTTIATASPSLGCASSGTIPATASPSLGCASSGTTIATTSSPMTTTTFVPVTTTGIQFNASTTICNTLPTTGISFVQRTSICNMLPTTGIQFVQPTSTSNVRPTTGIQFDLTSTAVGSIRCRLYHVQYVYDATLGYPGEGWKGRRGARERMGRLLLAFHNVQTLAGCVEPHGASVHLKGDAIKEQMLIDCATDRQLYAMGIAEHRWTSTGERSAPRDWHCVHTSAGVSSGHGYKGGVGCYLSPPATKAWRNFGSHVDFVDERILTLRLPIGGFHEKRFTFNSTQVNPGITVDNASAITMIVPGSAADHAGILPGMRVISVDGAKWQHSDNATRCIQFAETSAAPTHSIVLSVPRIASLIVYYAPHSQRPRDERKAFWDLLEVTVNGIPKHDVLVLLGDSNACLGDVCTAGVTGPHGVGKCNAGGRELSDWCSNIQLRVMNGYFAKGLGAQQTWRPPADPPVPWEHGLTIDHCITRSRDAAVITNVDVCSPAEYKSDHRMLVVSLTPLRGQAAWQRKMQRKQTIERFDISALTNATKRRDFVSCMNGLLRDTPTDSIVNQEWANISQAIQSASATALGKCTPRHRTWQDEFSARLAAMARERRELVQSHHHRDPGMVQPHHHRDPVDSERCQADLRQLRAAHQRETRSFVRGWWKRTIQSLSGPNGGPNISTVKKLEETIAPTGKQSARTELFSADQKTMCRTPAAKQERWREHFAQLFATENKVDLSYVYERTPRRPLLTHLDAAPTNDEVARSIRALKRKRAAGADGIVAELLQAGGPRLHDRLANFVRMVWQHGEVPKEWRDAVVITLPKTGDLRLCDNWRGISLISVPGKILAQLIVQRLTPVTESVLSETTNGFRPGRGCDDVVAFVRDLLEQVNSVKTNSSLHTIFVDLKRCFDSLSRTGIWAVLERLGVPPKMLSVIKSYHDGMEARVRCNGGLSEPFAVRRGVRQGCVLAPLLMNCFYAAVMSDWRRQVPAGVTIRFNIDGHLHNRSRAHPGRTIVKDAVYADDTSLMSTSWETAKLHWARYQQVCGKWGLTISYKKTKHMVAGNNDTQDESLTVPEGEPAIESVNHFPLLGCCVDKDGTYAPEVSRRLSSAGHMLHRLIPTLFKSKYLRPVDKYKAFQSFILSRLMVGAASRNLPRIQFRRLRKFYNRGLRHCANMTLLRMQATHVTDVDIRNKLGAPSFEELSDRVNLRWAGHVTQSDNGTMWVRCPFTDCDARYSGARRLQRLAMHYRKHVPRPRLKCHVCARKFKSATALTRHVRADVCSSCSNDSTDSDSSSRSNPDTSSDSGSDSSSEHSAHSGSHCSSGSSSNSSSACIFAHLITNTNAISSGIQMYANTTSVGSGDECAAGHLGDSLPPRRRRRHQVTPEFVERPVIDVRIGVNLFSCGKEDSSGGISADGWGPWAEPIGAGRAPAAADGSAAAANRRAGTAPRVRERDRARARIRERRKWEWEWDWNRGCGERIMDGSGFPGRAESFCALWEPIAAAAAAGAGAARRALAARVRDARARGGRARPPTAGGLPRRATAGDDELESELELELQSELELELEPELQWEPEWALCSELESEPESELVS
eukprot:gene17359-biopygen53959